jgi:hypothetical protein
MPLMPNKPEHLLQALKALQVQQIPWQCDPDETQCDPAEAEAAFLTVE